MTSSSPSKRMPFTHRPCNLSNLLSSVVTRTSGPPPISGSLNNTKIEGWAWGAHLYV